MAADELLTMPAELRVCKPVVENYVKAKIKQFAQEFARRLNPDISAEKVEQLMGDTLSGIALQEQIVGSTRVLRLVLRHDCQSTGCGDTGCLLCQYNPSRLCKRNLKIKYLIEDSLKAKCGSPLRVELVDEHGACVVEGLPAGIELEVHMLNGEKYKEICPDNTWLSHQQLKSCVISHHQKALLKRDGGSEDALRCFLSLERGQAPLSDLSVTTSSEALLAGKAPTFRLLVWAVDGLGEPVPNVTYVVSESFVVATKRVKHAIKSDIPSIADHVSKLVHIGKATVEKLVDVRGAAAKEGFKIHVPDELNCVDKVSIFQRLVELSEMHSDLKNKVRHLLKLSPEKYEEVCQHALSAVVPDFRPRVWWSTSIRAGLLFACKNGSVSMEHPIALVKMGDAQGRDDSVTPIHTLDPVLFNNIPKLKTQAVQSWYASTHPGWAIYWKEGGQQDPQVQSVLNQSQAGVVGSICETYPPQLPAIPVLQSGGGGNPTQPQPNNNPFAQVVTLPTTDNKPSNNSNNNNNNNNNNPFAQVATLPGGDHNPSLFLETGVTGGLSFDFGRGDSILGEQFVPTTHASTSAAAASEAAAPDASYPMPPPIGIPAPPYGIPKLLSTSPFAAITQASLAKEQQQQQQQQQQQGQQQQQQQGQQGLPSRLGGAASNGSKVAASSPFAHGTFMDNISDAFPIWQGQNGGGQEQRDGGAAATNPAAASPTTVDATAAEDAPTASSTMQPPNLGMLQSSELPGFERGASLEWGPMTSNLPSNLPSNILAGFNSDWTPQLDSTQTHANLPGGLNGFVASADGVGAGEQREDGQHGVKRSAADANLE